MLDEAAEATAGSAFCDAGPHALSIGAPAAKLSRMATRTLEPRTRPLQARSRATVDLVLDTALDLLAEVGADGFNTNLLAERAGVSVRAIYRYFPNKLAVLVALAERISEWERAWIGDLSRLRAGEDWRAAIDRAVDGYYEAASRQRGAAALRAAMQAFPELRAVEAAASARQQADLAEGLRALGVDLPPERLRAFSQVVIEAASRLLDIALISPPAHARLLIDELKRMLAAALAERLPQT
jgi:AcrR family transcriptional regulator